MDDPEEQEPARPEILIEREQMAGVWSNRALVTHGKHEFTIDFIRMDAAAPPPGRGVVVARVALSPLFMTQLIDALNESWTDYAKRALPKEIYGPEEPPEDNAQ